MLYCEPSIAEKLAIRLGKVDNSLPNKLVIADSRCVPCYGAVFGEREASSGCGIGVPPRRLLCNLERLNFSVSLVGNGKQSLLTTRSIQVSKWHGGDAGHNAVIETLCCNVSTLIMNVDEGANGDEVVNPGGVAGFQVDAAVAHGGAKIAVPEGAVQGVILVEVHDVGDVFQIVIVAE